MRVLFNVNPDGKVVIEPQALLLAPFRKLQDKYTDKSMAVVELALVYFTADYRSNFRSILDLEERITAVKNNLFRYRRLKIDKDTVTAIKFYEESQDTINIKLIKSVNNGLMKAITMIDASPMTDFKDIKEFTDIVTKLPSMVSNMLELEKIVMKGEATDTGVSGSGEKSIYEDM